MIYDLSDTKGVEACKKRLNALAKKKVKVDVKQAKKDGTDKQRKYFHKILRIVAQDRGEFFEDFKEAIILHLGYYKEVLGQKVRQKTAMMSKKEYSRLIDDYFLWANSEGYVLMTAEEYLKGEY